MWFVESLNWYHKFNSRSNGHGIVIWIKECPVSRRVILLFLNKDHEKKREP